MFADAQAYELIMGRWSTRLASSFVKFAGVQDGDRVLDVGSGTGSLALAVAAFTATAQVVGIDRSQEYVEYARSRTRDPRVRFETGDAQALPYSNASFDKALSMLVLNFLPEPERSVAEMRRVTRPGGTVAAAVWDYGDGMAMLRIFWDVAASLDPAASARHERHMPYCREGELATLWKNAGMVAVEERGISIPLEFASFQDFWSPFMGGQGPSGSYTVSLPPDRRKALKEGLRRALLGNHPDGPFPLEARAWAVKGIVPP